MKRNYSIFLVLISIMVLASLLGGCSKHVGYFDDYIKQYATVDISQYIKLANYKGLKYEKPEIQVSQDDIQDYVNQFLESTATTEKATSGIVDENSLVNIDFVGSIDGVEFDGGAGADTDLNIADNNFIDGFAESIIGHEVGENFDINVTFPENYGNADLAGKDAVFNITINYISLLNMPEYNNEWIKTNTDFTSKDEFEASIKEELHKNAEEDSQNDIKLSLFNQIVEASEIIKYPEETYNKYYEEYLSAYESYAEENDLDLADYLNEEMGMTEEDLFKIAKDAAEYETKRELVLFALLDAEEIHPTNEDFNTFLINLLEKFGYTEESYKEENGYTIQEYAEKNNFYQSYIYEIIMDNIVKYSIAN